MKRYAFSVFLFALALCCHAELVQVCADSLRNCDLLFVVNNRGNAITAVTEGTDSLPIDHVAIFYADAQNGAPMVMQADYKGVRRCGLQAFCAENGDSAAVLVGRLTVALDREKSLANAFTFLGKPYDYDYLPDDEAIYCSELVQKSYVDPSGNLVFSTIPMTFRNRDGAIPEFWLKHYAAKGIAVPEGAPGTNPGEMSRRKEVRIVGWLQMPFDN